jgi:glucosylceramidase
VRNWSKTVLEWNLASAPGYGPHTEGGCTNCQGALTLGSDIKRDVSYYVLAHASKFVRPGSVRIASNLLPSLPNVAFKTPSGDIVLIVLNEAPAMARFNIQYQGKTAATGLPGDSAGTFVILNPAVQSGFH